MFKAEVRNRGLELSWGEDHCPAVVVGNDVFGHSAIQEELWKMVILSTLTLE